MAYIFFLCGAILAALSVAIGAYGAHADIFDEVQTLWIDKAVRYQMFHALALIVTALAMANKRKIQMHLMADAAREPLWVAGRTVPRPARGSRATVMR